jgi:hypothetical protein
MKQYEWMERTNPELYAYYNSLNFQQQKYIAYRAQGLTKADSYRRSGYKSSQPTQSACIMEQKRPYIKAIVEEITTHKDLQTKLDASNQNKFFRDLAKNSTESKELEMLRNATSDEAIRINFYNDIINGTMKQTIKRKSRNEQGEMVLSSVEIKEPTFSDRMAARKELDKILGLKETGNVENKVISGDDNSKTVFNFNVVDTSSKFHAKQDFSIKDENGNDEIIEVEMEDKKEESDD